MWFGWDIRLLLFVSPFSVPWYYFFLKSISEWSPAKGPPYSYTNIQFPRMSHEFPILLKTPFIRIWREIYFSRFAHGFEISDRTKGRKRNWEFQNKPNRKAQLHTFSNLFFGIIIKTIGCFLSYQNLEKCCFPHLQTPHECNHCHSI